MTTPALLQPFLWRTANLRGLGILTPWLLQLLATDLLLSLLLPWSLLAPTSAYNISSWLAGLVWRGIQFIFTSVNGARITVSGDQLPQHESAVVVCNHAGSMSLFCKAAAPMGAFPRLGSVGDGYAADLEALGQGPKGARSRLSGPQGLSMAHVAN